MFFFFVNLGVDVDLIKSFCLSSGAPAQLSIDKNVDSSTVNCKNNLETVELFP